MRSTLSTTGVHGSRTSDLGLKNKESNSVSSIEVANSELLTLQILCSLLCHSTLFLIASPLVLQFSVSSWTLWKKSSLCLQRAHHFSKTSHSPAPHFISKQLSLVLCHRQWVKRVCKRVTFYNSLKGKTWSYIELTNSTLGLKLQFLSYCDCIQRNWKKNKLTLLKNPLLMGLVMWMAADIAPALSPHRVTALQSPPNFSMLSHTHCIASRWSFKQFLSRLLL